MKEIEETLMMWFFKLREAGIPVNVGVMVLKAGVLDPEFAQKSWSASYQAMQRLLKAKCITIRAGTWVSHAICALVDVLEAAHNKHTLHCLH